MPKVKKLAGIFPEKASVLGEIITFNENGEADASDAQAEKLSGVPGYEILGDKSFIHKASEAEELAAEDAEKLAAGEAEKLAAGEAEKLAAEEAEKLAAEEAVDKKVVVNAPRRTAPRIKE